VYIVGPAIAVIVVALVLVMTYTVIAHGLDRGGRYR
jgi:hypothetical protein